MTRWSSGLRHCPFTAVTWGRIPYGSFSYNIIAGWSSLVARRAHNPKVAGSNPAPAIMVPWSSWFRTPACHAGDHEFESRWNRLEEWNFYLLNLRELIQLSVLTLFLCSDYSIDEQLDLKALCQILLMNRQRQY